MNMEERENNILEIRGLTKHVKFNPPGRGNDPDVR